MVVPSPASPCCGWSSPGNTIHFIMSHICFPTFSKPLSSSSRLSLPLLLPLRQQSTGPKSLHPRAWRDCVLAPDAVQFRRHTSARNAHSLSADSEAGGRAPWLYSFHPDDLSSRPASL